MTYHVVLGIGTEYLTSYLELGSHAQQTLLTKSVTKGCLQIACAVLSILVARTSGWWNLGNLENSVVVFSTPHICTGFLLTLPDYKLLGSLAPRFFREKLTLPNKDTA